MLQTIFLAALMVTAGKGYECKDKNSMCGKWAADGECNVNPSYMLLNCEISCNSCGISSVEIVEPVANGCEDLTPMCPEYSKNNGCNKNIGYMKKICKKTCNHCAAGEVAPIPTGCLDDSPECSLWKAKGFCPTSEYMSIHCRATCPQCGCQDKHQTCKQWTKFGECSVNPIYMKINCALSCDSCGTVVEDIIQPEPKGCEDLSAKCFDYRKNNGCSRNTGFMNRVCKKSCNLCTDGEKSPSPPKKCKDRSPECSKWKTGGFCETYPEFMNVNCKETCSILYCLESFFKSPINIPKLPTRITDFPF